MNIFFLDPDPDTCAQLHCDKHNVKMILEYAQLLSTAHHVIDGDDAPPGIYKVTHRNHPSAVWVRESIQHYRWLHKLLDACCLDYTRRYQRTHKVERSGLLFTLGPAPRNLDNHGWQDPPQCMPDEYKAPSAVSAYHSYYRGDKSRFAVWKLGNTPAFM